MYDGMKENMQCVGAKGLLSTARVALMCSSRCPGTIIVKALDLALALRDSAATVVSGFHTSMEKECLATLLRGRHPVIVCPARSVEKMRVPTAWKDAIAAGGLLVASPFEPRHRRVTAQLAEERNRFVVSLADEVIVAHASPGGKLERLCAEIAVAGKQLWTLDDPANSHLLALGASMIRLDAVAKRWPKATGAQSLDRSPSASETSPVFSRAD